VGPRVLLVEDEPTIRFAIHDFLASSGYEIDEAETLRSADAHLRSGHPDALIVDIRLPDGDALEWIPRWKRIPGGPAVIVLSARASAGAAEEALRIGAERYLTKPVKLRELLLALEEVIRGRPSS
jgi:DNA-binding response OmpR family regulator